MGKTLEQIALELKDTVKKVQLIYAFNGTGKTRLSREFTKLIASQGISIEGDENDDPPDQPSKKILYYNAFTEDLFYWNNDLHFYDRPALKIQPNSFTTWILHDQGQDQNIINNFQRYASDKLTPKFRSETVEVDNPASASKEVVRLPYSDVTFSVMSGDNNVSENIKISKGEESVFIWSVFFTLLEQVISVLNVTDVFERETSQFDELEYVFIDDPVSSLDENHLIQLAVDLAELIIRAPKGLKFLISTHNPLFFNVLVNAFSFSKKGQNYNPRDEFEKYRLSKSEDGLFQLEKQRNDSPFSYHLFLIAELKKAIESGEVRKYHYNLLRNVLEKTATFLGYDHWSGLLPKGEDGKPNPYESKIIDISSHSKHSGEEVSDITEDDKRVLGYIFKNLITNFGYRK
jgi:hypothetical protein